MSVNAITRSLQHVDAPIAAEGHRSSVSTLSSAVGHTSPTPVERYGVAQLEYLRSQPHGNLPNVDYRRRELSAPLKVIGDAGYNQPIVLDAKAAKNDALFIADALSNLLSGGTSLGFKTAVGVGGAYLGMKTGKALEELLAAGAKAQRIDVGNFRKTLIEHGWGMRPSYDLLPHSAAMQIAEELFKTNLIRSGEARIIKGFGNVEGNTAVVRLSNSSHNLLSTFAQGEIQHLRQLLPNENLALNYLMIGRNWKAGMGFDFGGHIDPEVYWLGARALTGLNATVYPYARLTADIQRRGRYFKNDQLGEAIQPDPGTTLYLSGGKRAHIAPPTVHSTPTYKVLSEDDIKGPLDERYSVFMNIRSNAKD